MSTYTLTDAQCAHAESLVDPAIAFVRERGAALAEALIAAQWRGGDPQSVGTALAAYQNPDGGFGHRLEPDITSPVSNPFAARIAMQILLAVPEAAAGELVSGLAGWLDSAQDEDGDWHFAPEVLESPIAPWFGGWTFPSLNPACCVTGLATALGVASPRMRARTATLFERLADPGSIPNAEFYVLLPYVEYTHGNLLPEAYLEPVAARIRALANGGGYENAMHFFGHALGGSAELARLVGSDLIASWADRLLGEVSDDGGWPTPYDDAWRVWETASALGVLGRLRTEI